MTQQQIQDYNGKILPKFPNYIIFPQGKVYAIKTKKFISQTYRPRNPKDINSKYSVTVNLKDADSESKYPVLVHRLVAMAFIPNPENKPAVNHKDGNPSNNDVSNLEWVTPQENIQHAVDNRLHTGRYTACSKYRLVANEEVIDTYSSITYAAESVRDIINGRIASGISNIANTCKLNKLNNGLAYFSYGYVWRYIGVQSVARTSTPLETIYEYPIEEYKPIKHNTRYLISKSGMVYDSVKGTHITIAITKYTNGDSYYTCVLHVSGKKYTTQKIHRLVAQTFLECDNSTSVFFKNNNTLDCRLDNLTLGKNEHTKKAVQKIKLTYTEELVDTYDSLTQAAATVNTCVSSVAEVALKNKDVPVGEKPYTSNGYVFRYIS